MIGLIASTAVCAGIVTWQAGYRPQNAWQERVVPLETVAIDRGDLAAMVVETGSVESASNVTVRCQVEALIGMVGGGKIGQTNQPKAAAASSATGVMVGGGSAATTGKAVGSSGKASSATSSGSSSAPSGDPAAGGAVASTTLTAPQIASFSMTVPPYVPLRPAAKSSSSTISKKSSAASGSSRGGGGETEKPGSTRILWILPEGTPVKPGDIVCELDSAAFRDEVLVQRIKKDQADAFVKQAKALLGVNQLALKEYTEGVLPQDQLLISQYVSACETDYDRLKRNVEWSEGVTKKGFRSPSQHFADILSLQRAEIALANAKTMQERLNRHTSVKLIKSLEAKLEANRADVFAQESAFQLESDRLRRLERMVENCTLRAPGEGIVVYALPPSNGWRTSSTLIQEGVTVREGQPIFELPAVEHMRVKARVNESKVRQLEVGQKASIRIDAFPDRELQGSISEITVIPAPGAGPFSDTRVYFANVTIDSGDLRGLRPGLSAEVSFKVGERDEVTRIPQAAIRWQSGRSFAAVATVPERTKWEWRPIELGMMNETFAEVLSGLDVGDQVVANPNALSTSPPIVQEATLQASGEAPKKPNG